MKNSAKSLGILLCVLVFAPLLGAQSLTGMSLNGATGLYTIPTARIGWDEGADVGLDLGYHAIAANSRMTHIPAVALSLFKWLELSAAFDIQPEYYEHYTHNDDLLLGLKIQLPRNLIRGGTSLAIGGNFQFHNLKDGSVYRPADEEFGSENMVFQVYGAVSYAGNFFTMPAETTVALGKTIILRDASYFDRTGQNKDIDFGMGFDLTLFPKAMGNYVHLVIDFSNFTYSALPYPRGMSNRGILNTGVRIDLSAIPPLRKFKFNAEFLGVDLLDEDRSFGFGVVFGIPVS